MADQDIKPFLFESERLVRTVEVDATPWFVAKDVAEALEYKWNGNSRIAHVPERWRGVTSVVTPSGIQQMAILSEQGLYFFLGRSDKPKALPFQIWLAGEVLPTIRRTGSYSPQGSVEVMRRKPFEEWTVEEVNAYRGLVTEARHTLNVAAAAWMMERLGFPMPPRHLLPAWQQGIEGF